MRNCPHVLLGLLMLSVALAAPVQAGEKEAKEALGKGIATQDIGMVSQALQDLAATNRTSAIQIIFKVGLATEQLDNLTASQQLEVFKAAQQALVGVTDDDAVEFLEKALAGRTKEGRDPRVRVMLVEVFGEKGGAGAVQALIGVVEKPDKDENVRRVAITQLARVGDKEAIAPLIDHMARIEKYGGLEFEEVKQALTTLTGRELFSADDYKAWWGANERNFTGPGSGSEAAPGGGRGSGTVLRERPKLFGQEIISKKIVFILDVSGSMTAKDPPSEGGDGDAGRGGSTGRPGGGATPPPGGGNLGADRERLHRAKEELKKVVQMLDRDVLFTIIAYSGDNSPANKDHGRIKVWAKGAKDLAPATPGNKSDAIKFIDGFQAEGFTWTDKALERAFDFPRANTFYLLSDGAPTHDGSTPLNTQEILDMVEGKNKFAKKKIFTLGFRGANVQFMEALANLTGGEYRDIR